ncbi:MAG TPA: hypothetical protein ENI27_01660 [bacterium]|nr:hypothetical protein [bacterium]
MNKAKCEKCGRISTEVDLVKLMKKADEVLPTFRFHLYGSIDVNMPDEFSNVQDVLESIQGYGEAKVIHVELVEKAK